MKKTIVVVISLVSVSLFSCNTPTSSSGAPIALPTAGLYDGFILKNTNSNSNEEFLSGSLTTPSSSEFDFVLKDDDGSFSIIAKEASTDSIEVTLSIASAPITLKWDSSVNCFTSTDSELCLNNQEISMHLTDKSSTEYVIVVDPHQANPPGSTQTPKVYSVSQIINLGKNQSFNSQIQFATAQKSREDAITAHMNLLPNISLSDALGFLSPFTVMDFIHGIGDLAPFLLPSRWIAASQATQAATSDYYGYLIMKGDSANIAEGLALGVLRDEASLASLKTYAAPITQLRDKVKDGELLGIEAPGSSDALTTVLESLQATEVGLTETISEEKTDLASAIGLISANAVKDVTWSNLYPSVDKPIKINQTSTLSLVIDRALELKQMDALLQETKDSADNRYFYWMDPSGGQGSNIGFGWPSSIEAGKDQVQEIEDETQQLQSTLEQKLKDTESQIQLAVENYQLSKNDLALQQQRLTQLNDDQNMGVTVAVSDLQNALQSVLQYQGSMINAEYTYYIALGKLNRLLFSGPYADIESPVAGSSTPVKPTPTESSTASK